MTHSISLSFIQALGFGVHRPHATLPGPSVRAPTLSPCRFRLPHTFMRTLRLWPSSLGPCTSRRHRRFLQRLYFHVHLAAHFAWSPSFS
ncbi:hypothetical protein C8J57DRAFT_1727774, partial [Mycena rebaudengoi]